MPLTCRLIDDAVQFADPFINVPSGAFYIPVLSPSFFQSLWCRAEIDHYAAARTPIFPVDTGMATNIDDVLPPVLLTTQRCNFYDREMLEHRPPRRYQRSDPKYFGRVEELAETIGRTLARAFPSIHDIVDLVLGASLEGIDHKAPPPFDYHVFVSYTRRDDEFSVVADIVSTITSSMKRSGIDLPPYFYDKKDIGQWAGDPGGLKPLLQGYIQRSCSMIAVLTPSYAQSDWCCWEWQFMRTLQRPTLNGRVMPVPWTRLDPDKQRFAQQNLEGLALGNLGNGVYLDEGWVTFKSFLRDHGGSIARGMQTRLGGFGDQRRPSYTQIEQAFLAAVGEEDPPQAGYARQLTAELHRIGDFIREGYEAATQS